MMSEELRIKNEEWGKMNGEGEINDERKILNDE